MGNQSSLKVILWVTFFILLNTTAQDENLFDDNMLEELMNTPISVATITEQSLPETPGSITVITSKDIERLGSRDLIDVLNHVPGFEVGYDITGTYGLAVRGVWANEGKVLVLMDGIELNDDMYYSFQYGHHIPVEIIDRIEIIRGPGSVIYGGAAELAVISIITKHPVYESEGFISAQSGFTRETYARRGTSFYYGLKEEDWTMSLNGGIQEGHHSNRSFEDLWGYTYDTGVDGNSKNRSILLNGTVNYKGWKHRFIYDRYRTRQNYDGFDVWAIHFHSYLYQTLYDFKINDKLTIRPKFQFKQQEPWNAPGNSQGVDKFDIQSRKYTGEITAFYQLDHHELLFGIGHDWVSGEDKRNEGILGRNGINNFNYQNLSVFGQGIFRFEFANFTIGGRYEDNDEFGSNFVPRLAITKQFGNHYIKFMASKAFRTPSIQNMAYNENIKTEETDVLELETGLQLSNKTHLTANVFYQNIKDPIIFFYTGTSSYENGDKVSTAGYELSLKHIDDNADYNLSYSFYKALNVEVDEYKVPDSAMTLGQPQHKLAASATFKFNDQLFITPSATFTSNRWAVNSVSPTTYKKTSDRVIFNLTVLKKNFLGIKNLEASASIHNLFDERFDYIQPYIGWEAPFPGPGRELFLKVTYSF